MAIKTDSYKLRSAGLMPIGPGNFIVQSFGVDHNVITIYSSITTLPDSSEFIGWNPRGEYSSASFQRLPYLLGNSQVFSGQTVSKTFFNTSKEDQFLNR